MLDEEYTDERFADPADGHAERLPAPGTFGVTQRVTLLCCHAGATIHYTIGRGARQADQSPTFDAYQLPVLEAINDGDGGVSTTYTVHAIAISDGLAPSDMATFTS